MSNRPPASEDEHIAKSRYVAVAIDKDKNSRFAVKWAIDYLLTNSSTLLLIHVKNKANPNQNGFSSAEPTQENSNVQSDEAANQLFLPYRGFCARKQARYKEVLLEDNDIPKAIIDYINKTCVDNLVIGASTRNAISRKFKHVDIQASLTKGVPDFCGVYMVSKGKMHMIRGSSRPTPLHPEATISTQNESDDVVTSPFLRGGNSSGRAPPGANDRRLMDRTPRAERPLASPRSVHPNISNHQHFRDNSTANLDFSFSGGGPQTPRLSNSSMADFSMVHDPFGHRGGGGFQSMELSADGFEPFASNDNPRSSFSTQSSRDVEAEMKRLRQELKQTMDMYSTACKEATSAKQRARELHQWKMEEAQKFEVAKMGEEAALAIAEMEKAKAKAAIEAAEAAQRIAEMEAQKRMNAEMKARWEAEEKKKALYKLAHNDFRYRKYPIEDIEVATEFFSESLKIGEGGYGPVYRAYLDHTPVAIKVLRPDAAQGRQQFQQEIEVLSCIRHPNMVLLLGACPEYGCLVYEYMDNGSLEDRLFRRGNTPVISWRIRFKIAAEIATGLLFLHQTKPEPLVHRDLKPANILLDRNYVSKISDVGLARLVPPSVADNVTQYRMTSAAGTFCYIDPEYQQTGMLGIKSDIYSLGIMLLQIITAKPPMGLSHHVERAIARGTFADMLDPAVPDWPVEEALIFARLALQCAELRRKDRPDLGTVLLPELNRLKNLGSDDGHSSSGTAGSLAPFSSTYHSRPHSIALQEMTRSHPDGGGEMGSFAGEGVAGWRTFTGGAT